MWDRSGLILPLTVLVLLLLPGLGAYVGLMLLFRAAAGRLARRFRPDLGSLLEPSSAAFAVDLIHRPVQTIPIIITVYLNGTLTVGEFRAAVQRLVTERDPASGALVRPELRQYVTSWLGLLFWAWDPAFDLTRHVRIFTEHAARPVVDEDDMLEIGNQILATPFAPCRSPWEFLLLHNCREKTDLSSEPRTVVILRVHHGLGDGYSLLKLVMEDMSKVKLRLAQPKATGPRRDGRNGGRLWEALSYPVRAAYEFAGAVIESCDVNDWHVPEDKLARRLNGGVSQPIPLAFVKSIKEDYGVTFTSVLLAAFAGGIRNFMMEKGFAVPEVIHCLTILPFPGHPFKLRNHLTGGFARLPLGMADAQDRLAAVEANLQKLRTSTVPTTMFYLMKVAGLQFSPLTYRLFRNSLTTAVMTNFPGPEDEANFIGIPIRDGGFAAGFGPGNTTIGLSSLSYNGRLRIAAGFDEAVLPRSVHWQELIDRVIEEFHILAKRSPKNVLDAGNNNEELLKHTLGLGSRNGNSAHEKKIA